MLEIIILIVGTLIIVGVSKNEKATKGVKVFVISTLSFVMFIAFVALFIPEEEKAIAQTEKQKIDKFFEDMRISAEKQETNITYTKEQNDYFIKRKNQLKTLFRDFLSFKDKEDFYYYGFSKDPYKKWLESITLVSHEYNTDSSDKTLKFINWCYKNNDIDFDSLSYIASDILSNKGSITKYFDKVKFETMKKVLK